MGGFVGDIAYEGNLAPFLSLLQAGEILHVGKAATFGLGRYEMRLQSGCLPWSEDRPGSDADCF